MAITLLAPFAGEVAQAAPTASSCEPLLILIEGGGWSDSSRGQSIRDLAAELGRKYRDHNITVTTVDHRLFMDGFNFSGPVDKAARAIEESNHWPVVVVGHSLGAHTAYRIAQRLPVSLLVTLDGVSFFGNEQHLPHPGNGAKWVDVDATGDSPGPDWNGQKRANAWVTDFDAGHHEVKKMFAYAKGHVEEALNSCSAPARRKTVAESVLCLSPGVSCNVSWELTDSCPKGATTKVRFFEFDETNEKRGQHAGSCSK